jgi:lipoprotein-releasing system permease protein
MNLPVYIARRYFFAKKTHNAINIISLIAVIGVAIGTMALVTILSVFNGFDRLVKSLFNSFDPDIRITKAEGKTFIPDSVLFNRIKNHGSVLYYSEVVEENALLRYGDKQYVANIKGVDTSYSRLTGVDSMIIEGEFNLMKNNRPYALVGQGVAYYLGIGLHFIDPIMIYVPRRTAGVSLNPENAFSRRFIYPSGIFRIEQEVDSKYIILPISFARDLLEYDKEVTSIEIQLNPAFDAQKAYKELGKILGPAYVIKDRYQQKEFFYKILKSEKWAIFFILSFILMVASFNIVGSLTMLILDKKKDIAVLHSMGTNANTLRRIFLTEGFFIALAGAILGLCLGALICYLQMKFSLIHLQGSGSFVIDAYPIFMKASDFCLVFLTVLLIGSLAAWYPVRFISQKSFFGSLHL